MNSAIHTQAIAAQQPAWAKEYEDILDAYVQAGGNKASLQATGTAVLVVSANHILASNEVPGVHFESEELPNGVSVRIAIEPGSRIGRPVHLCFGMLPAEGQQEIHAEYIIGKDAAVQFLAHCTFPNALKLQHVMDATMHLEAGSIMHYTESHFHGPHGGIEVLPRARVVVADGAQFLSTFSLIHGRVGQLAIDYEVDVGAGGIAELTTKAYGWSDDHVRVNEILHLNGEAARGLTKTRVAVRERATSEIQTTAEGNAPLARGHMDCMEVVRDRAVASNMPVVVVRNDRARVTHEAAIGTVSKKEMETLMARGLGEEAAVDLIIRGMLE
jgi:hypothetical protein